MTDLLTITNVSKKYPSPTNQWAVESLSVTVEKGGFFCLVGASGCGKSTVLKMIAGLEKPSSGKINKPENVTMVFQSGALFPWLSVEDNASFGLRMKEKLPAGYRQTVAGCLEMVGLKDLKNKYPRELSGGQRQRVGIARALVVNPELLLLDEPFSALDFLTTEELHKDLLRIWQKTRVTIVMVSHLLEEAVILADKVGIMSSGKLRAVVEIDLPRPRVSQSQQFFDKIATIKNFLV